MKYTKNCPKCNIIQTYSSSGNCKRAIRLNTLCRTCNQRIENPTRNLKISESLKGKPKSKESVEKMKKSLRTCWGNKTDGEMNEWRRVVSKTSKERWDDPDYKKRVSNSVANHWKSLSVEERTIRFNNQQKNGAGICRYHMVGDYRVYGFVEKRYITGLYNSNLEMPLNVKRRGIKTPYGMVFIDFEYSSYFVEIKSTFTFDKLVKERELENSQLRKIMWVNDNIKPVKILVEIERHTFSDYTELAFIGIQNVEHYSGLLSLENY